jgi:hypothetical protein
MTLKLEVTDIERPHYSSERQAGWSGKVHISAHSDLGEMKFILSFQKASSIEDGVKKAMLILASFGQTLGNEAASYASYGGEVYGQS